MRPQLLMALLWVLGWSGELLAQDARQHVPNPYGEPIEETEPASRKPLPWLELHGQFRLRGGLLGNSDLGRGPLPTTGLLLNGAGSGSQGETVGTTDMRFLFDPSIVVGPEVRIGMRFGLLENVTLGGTPSSYPASSDFPMPSASSSQTPPTAGINSLSDSIVLHRLWVEWLSPVGLLVAGRMGSDWGLGIVANSGSCIDCDVQQSVDRVGWVLSLYDLLWMVAFDYDASGASLGNSGRGLSGPLDLTDRDDVRTFSFALSRTLTPEMAHGRVRRGRVAWMWGVALSYRWQAEDLPGYYYTDIEEWEGSAESGEFVQRGMKAVLVDGWIRVWHPRFRLEGEGAWMWSRMDNASMMAGIDMGEVTGNQWGGVLRGSFLPWPQLECRFEGGIASGDDAWGFGVDPGSSFSPQPGDLDGAQTDFDTDRTVDNFRFNVNYHVDEILWRRLIGTVSDGLYLRPELRYKPSSWLRLDAAVVYSRALFAQSTPGLARDLGIESILAATLSGRDGLFVRGALAWLHPLDGLRNPLTGASPQDAWSLRAIAGVRF